MSKQAKRLRQQQRAAGIEPKLDMKRRLRCEEQAAIEAKQAAAEKFRREQPEEYARQQAESSRRAQRTFTTIMGAIGALGGGRF